MKTEATSTVSKFIYILRLAVRLLLAARLNVLINTIVSFSDRLIARRETIKIKSLVVWFRSHIFRLLRLSCETEKLHRTTWRYSVHSTRTRHDDISFSRRRLQYELEHHHHDKDADVISFSRKVPAQPTDRSLR